ncbi:MAG TPA: tetratricopeptide repeat protein, partial [Gemmatales bacterium]|nr:tetratricopeptide repeat protein [Gemmatales bacterium]
ELQDWDVGDKFYRIAVDRAKVQNNSRRIVITYLTWVDLLTEAKRFEAAEKTCQEILELDGDDDGSLIPIGKAYALRSLVRLAAIQGKVKDAFRKLERVNDEIPFHAETKAWLLQFTGKYDDAEEIYLRLYQRLDPDDERLESEREKFARILGSMYGDMGDVDKATKMLRPLLLKKPDDAGLNNDLGYIWADLKHNVDEAAAMIKKAVDAEPDNSSFLDSYGWALFRQGKLEEARDFLKRATAKPRGQNIEILDHYAEVLWALGERDEAKAIWKKAVEVATPAHRDQQRKQAIERRLGSGGESKAGPAR